MCPRLKGSCVCVFPSAFPGVVVSVARTFITFPLLPKNWWQERFAVSYRCMQSGFYFLLRKCNVPHANWLLWLAPHPLGHSSCHPAKGKSHSGSLFGTAIAFNVNFFCAPLAKKIWKIFVIELFEMYNKHSSGFAECRGYAKGGYPEGRDSGRGYRVWELPLMWSRNFVGELAKRKWAT